ncbi:hypothetical protein [uncultured Gammaproteobacteria bacterium]|nr:hypothetical protein [uncultured Gammaproteobacteria bacterium]
MALFRIQLLLNMPPYTHLSSTNLYFGCFKGLIFKNFSKFS